MADVTDLERDDVVRELIRHCGDGRLTLDELEDRITEAHAASTRAELRHALRELPPFRRDPVDATPAPAAGVPVARPRDRHRRRQAARRCGPRRVAGPPLFLIPVVVVISHLAR